MYGDLQEMIDSPPLELHHSKWLIAHLCEQVETCQTILAAVTKTLGKLNIDSISTTRPAQQESRCDRLYSPSREPARPIIIYMSMY